MTSPEPLPPSTPGDPPPAPLPVRGARRRGPLAVNLPAGTAVAGVDSAPDTPDLRLPHEHDQSGVDATAAAPDPVVVQAGRDLAAGQVDTDLRNPGGLDDGRRRRLLKQQP